MSVRKGSSSPRIHLRTVCYLVYGSLVLSLLGGLIAFESMFRRLEDRLMNLAKVGAQLSELAEEYRTVATRRQAHLLAYLLGSDGASLQAYRESTRGQFEGSLRLATLASDSEEGEIIHRLVRIRELEQRWEREFADPILRLRPSQGAAPVEPALSKRGEELSMQLDAELRELSRISHDRWVQLNADLVYAHRQHSGWATWLVVAIVLISAGGLWWISRILEAPLLELNALTQAVVDGDPVDPPEPGGFHEVNQLREDFAAMVQSLRDRENQLLASQADTARTNQDLLTLTEYAQFLQRISNEEEIARALIRQVSRVTTAPQVGLYLLHRTRPTFELAASHPGPDAAELLLSRTVSADACSVARNNLKVQVLDSLCELSASCQLGCSGQRSELCVPLSDGNHVVGMLHLASPQPVGWSREAVKLVTSLASFTAPTISNLRLLEVMREQATRDPLTGLFNRRYLDEYLPMAIETARRNDSALGLLMCDIDRFKAINDEYGHDVGDDVLRQVASVLRENVRASDVVCRCGGEEFVVVLPCSDRAGAFTIAEKLRALTAQRVVRPSSVAGEPLTISIGVAAFPDDARGSMDLLKAADLACYRAKGNGRNRTEQFSDAPPEPWLRGSAGRVKASAGSLPEKESP